MEPPSYRACFLLRDNNFYLISDLQATDREKDYTCSVYYCDTRMNNWHYSTSLNREHVNCAAYFYKDDLFLSGGEHLSYYSGCLEVLHYSDLYKSSTIISSMPKKKKGNFLIPYQSNLWAIGDDNKYLNICIYNPDSTS